MRRGIHSNNRRELSEGRDPFLTTCSSETDSYRADMGLRFRVRGLCVEAQTMRPLSKSKTSKPVQDLASLPDAQAVPSLYKRNFKLQQSRVHASLDT